MAQETAAKNALVAFKAARSTRNAEVDAARAKGLADDGEEEEEEEEEEQGQRQQDECVEEAEETLPKRRKVTVPFAYMNLLFRCC